MTPSNRIFPTNGGRPNSGGNQNGCGRRAPVRTPLFDHFARTSHALSKHHALPTCPNVDPLHLTVIHKPLPVKACSRAEQRIFHSRVSIAKPHSTHLTVVKHSIYNEASIDRQSTNPLRQPCPNPTNFYALWCTPIRTGPPSKLARVWTRSWASPSKAKRWKSPSPRF